MTTTTANTVSPTQEEAFRQVLPRAATVPEEKVRRRGDAQLALDNVQQGLRNVMARKADLETAWPPARVQKLDEGLTLAMAATFASSRAQQLDVQDSVLRALITSMYEHREQVFTVLDMAVAFGLLPADRVAKIRAGTGPVDGGQDLVDAVALLREFSGALENKAPITPAWMAETEQLGNRVVLEVKTTGARQETNATAADAARDANRVWTLLVEWHAELRKAGFELWGDAVGDHVPPLQSRQGVRASTPGGGNTPVG